METYSIGAQLIADERVRQVTEEGYSREHDSGHLIMRFGQVTRIPLLDAATCYVQAGRTAELNPGLDVGRLSAGEYWPWLRSDWKPSDDPIRNLVKAGALIAAEIDRLQLQQGD